MFLSVLVGWKAKASTALSVCKIRSQFPAVWGWHKYSKWATVRQRKSLDFVFARGLIKHFHGYRRVEQFSQHSHIDPHSTFKFMSVIYECIHPKSSKLSKKYFSVSTFLAKMIFVHTWSLPLLKSVAYTLSSCRNNWKCPKAIGNLNSSYKLLV